jgi:ribosomal peptide maturation radical SAM protein 1
MRPLEAYLGDQRGDLLLICPPFEGIDRPSLGLHIIQGIAQRAGLESHIFYANLSLASQLGESTYLSVAYSPPLDILGERLFSKYAFPDSIFDPLSAFFISDRLRASQERNNVPEIEHRIEEIEMQIGEWLSQFRVFARGLDYKIFGFSTMFAQNLACTCLIKILREEIPSAVILIGGANCDGAMAEGISRLCPSVDYVFSGESEITFRKFCDDFSANILPEDRIIRGALNSEWENFPLPNYSTFFDQLRYFLPDSELMQSGQVFVPYETSRGCWWGQKSHCTFCGLNGTGMAFRQKNAELVFSDLQKIAADASVRRVGMTDNIMPVTYFKDLLPKLIENRLELDIFYEQKSNLKRGQLVDLMSAGVNSIQPGIEALSTSLLKRMRKGVSASQNISVLRDARSLGLDLTWNLLYGFPGETEVDYISVISLIPLMVHLAPPNGCSAVSFDRFSPYFDNPSEFGITDLRPHPRYLKVYPPSIGSIDLLAYHFVGAAATLANSSPDTLLALRSETRMWIDRWKSPVRPILSIVEIGEGFLLIDTRCNELPVVELIDEELAIVLSSTLKRSGAVPSIAYERGWAVDLDGVTVGLASTTSKRLFGHQPIEKAEQRRWPIHQVDMHAK